MQRLSRPAAVVAILVLSLTGCGGEGPTTDLATGPAVESGAAEVVAGGFQFEPGTVEITAGTVTWSNEDDVDHTVTAGAPDAPDGAFDENLASGATAQVTFDEPGSHPYFCRIHPSMVGEVVVTG